MLTVDEIVNATGGTLVQGKLSSKIRGVSTNSKTVKKGELFIAIVGQRLDAHEFIKEAIHKGVAAILVSKETQTPPPVAVICVKDTTISLGLLAAYYRKNFSIPVIAVTGSAGKTTTKELIAAVLKKRYKVLKNVKTENNHFGVPLTLLKLKKFHTAAVLELGTNQPGDIAWLTRITLPTVCVFTNIGDSHLGGLKTRRGVFEEKLKMILGKPGPEAIIFNNDDHYLSSVAKFHLRAKKIRYGLKTISDFQAQNISSDGLKQIEFTVNTKHFRLKTPVIHNVSNALAAIACGRILNLNFSQIRKALAGYSFGLGRQEFRKIGRLCVIDDTYNSNPVSFQSAIQTLDGLKLTGRKILICADMLELGDKARILHEMMGKVVARSSIKLVLTLGRYTRFLQNSIKKTNKSMQGHHCQSLNEVHQHLKRFCRPGDALLIKGSRGMKMERTIDFLAKNFHLN